MTDDDTEPGGGIRLRTRTKTHINWLGGADPSWYGRVLGILHRDYPDIETQVWSTAIGENASEQVAKRESAKADGTGG